MIPASLRLAFDIILLAAVGMNVFAFYYNRRLARQWHLLNDLLVQICVRAAVMRYLARGHAKTANLTVNVEVIPLETEVRWRVER